MTITAKDYALLSKDAYNDYENKKEISLGGITYKVIDHYSNPLTGYQATAYQRLDTHEVIIAQRGTETKAGVIQDGLTDLGMVVTGFNAQLPDARAFAHRVKDDVEKRAIAKGYPIPPITLTGHSLGGALTEALAYEMHWQGVTFNSYGAVDMGYHIPEGGTQVTNYARVTDVVSSASHHYGHVILVATPADIDQLTAAGYNDTTTPNDLRNPISAFNLAAHSIDHFAPDDSSLMPSDLSPQNEARARAHGHAIHLFREDVQALRGHTLSLPWELQQKQATAYALASVAASAVLHGDVDKAAEIGSLAQHRAAVNAHHALDTAANTALLGIKAIDRMGESVATPLRQAASDVYNGLDRMGRALGSEAVERAGRHIAHDVSQSFGQARDALSHQETRGDIDKPSASREATRTRQPSETEQWMHRMIEALDSRDDKAIRRCAREAEESPIGRAFNAQVEALVQAQDFQRAHEQALQRNQQLEAMQQISQQQTMQRGRSR